MVRDKRTLPPFLKRLAARLAASAGRKSGQDAQCQRLLGDIFADLSSLAANFNASQGEAQARFSVRAPHVVAGANLSWRAAIFNSSWALTLTSNRQRIEIFLLRSSSLPTAEREETISTRRLALAVGNEGEALLLDSGEPLIGTELKAVLLAIFGELVARSQQELELSTSQVRLILGDKSLVGAVRELIYDNRRLATALLQKEEQSREMLSMEIHDDVISDLSLVCRRLAGSDNESYELVNGAISKLRALCSDLTSRDLRNWGLEHAIRQMLSRAAEVTDIDMTFETCTLPDLPVDVSIHVYRIMQEAVTNAIKHADATELSVKIAADDSVIEFCVEDNGKGMQSRPATDDCKRDGLRIMNERLKIIAARLRAELSVTSTGNGTRIALKLILPDRQR